MLFPHTSGLCKYLGVQLARKVRLISPRTMTKTRIKSEYLYPTQQISRQKMIHNCADKRVKYWNNPSKIPLIWLSGAAWAISIYTKSQMYIHLFGYCPVSIWGGEAVTITGEIPWTQLVTFTEQTKNGLMRHYSSQRGKTKPKKPTTTEKKQTKKKRNKRGKSSKTILILKKHTSHFWWSSGCRCSAEMARWEKSFSRL